MCVSINWAECVWGTDYCWNELGLCCSYISGGHGGHIANSNSKSQQMFLKCCAVRLRRCPHKAGEIQNWRFALPATPHCFHTVSDCFPKARHSHWNAQKCTKFPYCARSHLWPLCSMDTQEAFVRSHHHLTSLYSESSCFLTHMKAPFSGSHTLDTFFLKSTIFGLVYMEG